MQAARLAGLLAVVLGLSGCAHRAIPIVEQPFAPQHRVAGALDSPNGTPRVEIDCSGRLDWAACTRSSEQPATLVPGRYDANGRFIPSGQPR